MPRKMTPERIAEHQQTLRETLPRIATCTQGLDEEQLQAPPAPGAWSVVENLAHLRACAGVWGYSIYAAILKDHPTLADTHPRHWMKMQGYAKRSFAGNFVAMEV